MTNLKKKPVTDKRQLSLIDLIREEQERRKETRAGRLNLSAQLTAAIKEAIKKAPKSLEAIADEMSEMLGVKVTEATLNNFKAESHPHRFPAEWLHAFCRATGDMEPVRIISEGAGVYTLPGPDALRSEIRQWQEKEKAARAEKRKRELFLKELEQKR